MRDGRWHTFPIRICLLVSLLFFIYLGARRAVGGWYFRRESPDAIQKAMRWDPANPKYYDTLGTFMHLYADGGDSNQIVQLYESATRLSPHDAQFWADLGDGYDWAGRSHDALDAFQYARHLFPNSPEINWRLANFYVRAGNIPDALHTLRMVLLEDGSTARRVFTLARNATRDKEAILEMLPPQPPIFFNYLNFRIEEGDIAEAEEVWARVLQRDLPFDLREAFPYFDALIQHRELAQLSGTWAALTQRFPAQLQRLVVSPNLITNGGLEFDILNGGFDWRVIPTNGAIVGFESPSMGRATSIMAMWSNTCRFKRTHGTGFPVICVSRESPQTAGRDYRCVMPTIWAISSYQRKTSWVPQVGRNNKVNLRHPPILTCCS